MPLPALAGDDSTLLNGPGAQAPSPLGQAGDQTVTSQDQTRGAAEVLLKLGKSNQDALQAIAGQFPGVSKAANEMSQAFMQGVSGLIKEIMRTTQPDQMAAPASVR